MIEAFGTITAYHDTINDRYNPQEFVGRQWLIEEATRLRDDKDRRSLIIVGEPGSGKSTFLAYLADLWNCPRHFIRVDNRSGIAGVAPRAFLVSLGSQLYEKYGPDIFERGISGRTQVTVGWTKDQAEVVGLFVDELYNLSFLSPQQNDVQVTVGVATGDSKVVGKRIKRLVDVTLALDELTLLHVILINPVRKLQALYPNEKVIILVDALDESTHHAGTSILDVLPLSTDAEFPPNLRLVMTSRNGNHLSKFRTSDLLYIEDKKKGYWQANQEDIQSYIEKRLTEAPFTGMITTWNKEEVDSYMIRVREHSQNNFLYLYYFFEELVVTGGTEHRDLSSFGIPRGLSGIYRSFAVEKIRKTVESTVYITAREKIPISLCAQLKSLPDVSVVEVVEHDIFLTTSDSDQITPILFSLLLSAGVQIITFQTQKAEQLGVWEEKYLPILGVMAVAYEPLSREQIASFARIDSIYVDSVLERLKQFLDILVNEQATVYQFYHPSFSDYLLDSQQNQDYPLDASVYHHQIASYYRGKGSSWDEVTWSAIEDDYPFTHLVAHLVASGHHEEIHRLLASGTKQQRNIWYEVKKARGDSAGYLADVNRAWKLADTTYLSNDIVHTGQNIGYQCRYAFINASFFSKAFNIQPPLIRALLEKNVWNPAQALIYIRHMPGPKSQVSALASVLPYLKEPLRTKVSEEAIDVMQARSHLVDDEIIASLAPFLSVPLLQRAVIMAESISHYNGREFIPSDQRIAKALAALAPFLPSDEKVKISHKVVTIAQNITDSVARAEVLAALAPSLFPDEKVEILQQAVEATKQYKYNDPSNCSLSAEEILNYKNLPRGIIYFREGNRYVRWTPVRETNYARSGAASVILHFKHPQELVEIAVNKAQEFQVEAVRLEMLARQDHSLPLDQRAVILQQELNIRLKVINIIIIITTRNTSYAEKYLMQYLPDKMKEETLRELLQSMKYYAGEQLPLEPFLVYVHELLALKPFLSGKYLQQAIEMVSAIRDKTKRVQGLSKLASLLPEQGLREVLKTIEIATKDDFNWVETLAALTVFITENRREEILLEALETILMFEDSPDRAKALNSLLSLLTKKLEEDVALKVFRASLTIQDDVLRGEVLIKLGPSLSESQLDEAFENGRMTAEVLAGLAPYLSKPQVQKAWKRAQAYTYEIYRVRILRGLAPFLSNQQHQEALKMAQSMTFKPYQAEALLILFPFFSEEQKEETLQVVVEALEADHDGKLLKNMPIPLPESLQREALERVGAMQSIYQARKLISLLPFLSKPLRQEALKIAVTMRSEAMILADGNNVQDALTAEVLLALASSLSESSQLTAVRMVLGMKGNTIRVKTLEVLSPYLSQSVLENSLNMVLETYNDEYSKTEALILLISFTNAIEVEMLQRIVKAAKMIIDEQNRIRILVALLPFFPNVQKGEVLQDAIKAVQIESYYMKDEILTNIAPFLSKLQLQEVLEIVRTYHMGTPEALVALASSLPQELKEEVMQETIEALQYVYAPAEALAQLGNYLPERLLRRALEIVVARKKDHPE